MNTGFIYALRDPDTNARRYVGQTARDPLERFKEHCKPTKIRNHRTNCIRDMRSRGIPVLEVVAEVPVEELPMWEVAYIAFFREGGDDLVNGTLGGEGNNGPMSEETKEKLRRVNQGKKLSQETCKKLSARFSGSGNPMFGVAMSPTHKAKLAALNTGKKLSPETRAKIGLTHKGNTYRLGTHRTPEEKKKISAGMMGRLVSQETRTKIGAKHAGKTISLEVRAKISAALTGVKYGPERTETNRMLANRRWDKYRKEKLLCQVLSIP